MFIVYAVLVAVATAAVLILAPLVALRIWNEGARWMRRRSAGLFVVALAGSLAGCWPGVETGVDGGATGGGGAATTTQTTTSSTAEPDASADAFVCPTRDCPVGISNICGFNEFLAVCCQGGSAVNACARTAGILTHDCAVTCDSGLCAISALGTETCCTNSGSDDPCSKAVP